MADNSYSQTQDNDLIASIDLVFQEQKNTFRQCPYPSASQRIDNLKRLRAAFLKHQDSLISALNEDFGCRSADDSKMGDFMPTLMSIDYAIKHVKKWMKSSKRHVGALFRPAKAYVMYQPLGVIGIIAPWNYPLYLSIGPLATALAAGNSAMIKMSEFTPKTNQVLEVMLSELFESGQVAMFGGGPSVASHFSNKAFDHLLFTGSTRVGKLVMSAAAKNLTPVTLELGGKSPTLIDNDIDMKDAVSRFILGKTLNAGQTCVAPDYILCPSQRVEELIQACQHWFNKMYPTIEHNDDYTSIINDGQLNRLNEWLNDAKEKGANVITLGKETLAQCLKVGKMPLTLLTNVSSNMTLMQEEVFGPLLPIISYEDIDQALDFINGRDRPLALYICSHNPMLQKQILQQTHAGGVCINDAAMHVAQEDLPFGGVGPSGMGHYHGFIKPPFDPVKMYLVLDSIERAY